MRTLGTLILLSAAAFAQTPTAVQTPAPATVSVQAATSQPAQTGKPSPNGAKASGPSAAPKAKAAVPVKPAKATNTASAAKAKAVVAKAPASKSSAVAPNSKTVAVQAVTKPAAQDSKAKAVPQAVAKPATSDSKAKAVAVQAAKPASVDTKSKAVPAPASAVKPVAGPKAVPAAKSAPIVGVLVKPTAAPAAKGASQPTSVSVKAGSAGPKPAVAHVATKPTTVKAVAVKPVARVKNEGNKKAAAATVAGGPKVAPSVQVSKPAETKPVSEEVRSAGWRDPFVSPVVAMGATGSGCSAGKRCLTIDQIALKGVVKSESGMIAVVTNAVDKAYFLRENDPVFNGYVVKITGDSIIFKETFHDRLGKTMTRDVTKSITRPVA